MRFATSRREFLLALGAPFAAFASDWKSAPFPDWKEGTVLRLLTDSPWAKAKTLPFTWHEKIDEPVTWKDIPGANPDASSTAKGGSPVGGIGGGKPKLPNRIDLIFRWASALPVRHAKALYRQREQKSDPRNVSDLIEAPPDGYVFEIFGLPAIVAHQGTTVLEEKLRQSSAIKTGTGRTIKALRVEASVRGVDVVVLIHFSNREPVTFADREIECSGNAQVFEFKERFRLREMVYQNHLEI